MGVTKFGRGDIFLAFKLLNEVAGRIVSAYFRNFRDVHIGMSYKYSLCLLESEFLNIFERPHVICLFEKAAEMLGSYI